MLRCPNNPKHDVFIMTAMVPETWILNKDGDCEEIMECTGVSIESDLTHARCEECEVTVVIVYDE